MRKLVTESRPLIQHGWISEEDGAHSIIYSNPFCFLSASESLLNPCVSHSRFSTDTMSHIVTCVRPMTAPGSDVSSPALETIHASAACQRVSFTPRGEKISHSHSLIPSLYLSLLDISAFRLPHTFPSSYDFLWLFRYQHLEFQKPNGHRPMSRLSSTKWKASLESQ